MPAKRMQGKSAKQVTIDLLVAAGKPLHTKEIAKQVLDSGQCSSLKGKTPEATISAMLAVGSKAGGPFKRVDKGTYTVAAIETPSPGHGEQGTSPKPPAPKRRTATAKT